MKIRSGFVSNSSSSSFMLIGFKAPLEINGEFIEDIIDKFNKSNDVKLECITDDAPVCFVGKKIFRVNSDEGYVEVHELDLQGIEDYKVKIMAHEKEIFEAFGVTPEVKIFAGMVAS